MAGTVKAASDTQIEGLLSPPAACAGGVCSPCKRVMAALQCHPASCGSGRSHELPDTVFTSRRAGTQDERLDACISVSAAGSGSVGNLDRQLPATPSTGNLQGKHSWAKGRTSCCSWGSNR